MTTNGAALQVYYNEPSYFFGNENVKVAVTRQGGMMAPVVFFADTDRPVQPYHINPWWGEGCAPDTPSVLAVLRGDWFCAPFGGNDEPFDGMKYPPHGEPANSAWRWDGVEYPDAGAVMRMHQRQLLRNGTIRKTLAVRNGHNAVYQSHVMDGFSGPMCIGHHPNMFVPKGVDPGYLSFAPHRHAHTYIKPTETPVAKGYSILKPDTVIEDLRACPMIDGNTTDLTRYPAREGFEDIVMICAEEGLEFGWTAFALPSQGYMWFSLKDPKVLASTLLWMSNGGRHYPPWNGRHVGCIGLEEITAFFHEGLSSSVKKNFISDMGIPTCHDLSPDHPLEINVIQGVVRIDPDFKGVSAIERIDEDTLRLEDEEGHAVETKVELDFLNSGKLKDVIE